MPTPASQLRFDHRARSRPKVSDFSSGTLRALRCWSTAEQAKTTAASNATAHAPASRTAASLRSGGARSARAVRSTGRLAADLRSTRVVSGHGVFLDVGPLRRSRPFFPIRGPATSSTRSAAGSRCCRADQAYRTTCSTLQVPLVGGRVADQVDRRRLIAHRQVAFGVASTAVALDVMSAPARHGRVPAERALGSGIGHRRPDARGRSRRAREPGGRDALCQQLLLRIGTGVGAVDRRRVAGHVGPESPCGVEQSPSWWRSPRRRPCQCNGRFGRLTLGRSTVARGARPRYASGRPAHSSSRSSLLGACRPTGACGAHRAQRQDWAIGSWLLQGSVADARLTRRRRFGASGLGGLPG